MCEGELLDAHRLLLQMEEVLTRLSTLGQEVEDCPERVGELLKLESPSLHTALAHFRALLVRHEIRADTLSWPDGAGWTVARYRSSCKRNPWFQLLLTP